MRAMVLEAPRTPLVMRERPTPEPKQGEILVEIAACGVCRTDLHVVDGELQQPKSSHCSGPRDRRAHRRDRQWSFTRPRPTADISRV